MEGVSPSGLRGWLKGLEKEPSLGGGGVGREDGGLSCTILDSTEG